MLSLASLDKTAIGPVVFLPLRQTKSTLFAKRLLRLYSAGVVEIKGNAKMLPRPPHISLRQDHMTAKLWHVPSSGTRARPSPDLQQAVFNVNCEFWPIMSLHDEGSTGVRWLATSLLNHLVVRPSGGEVFARAHATPRLGQARFLRYGVLCRTVEIVRRFPNYQEKCGLWSGGRLCG